MTVEYRMTTIRKFKSKENCIEFLKEASIKNYIPVKIEDLELNNESVVMSGLSTTTTAIIREID